MTHTPGPWTIDKWGGADYVISSPEADVADTFTEANARLVAAAPDLLAALEDILGMLQDLDADRSTAVDTFADIGQRATAALAKAREEA